MKRLRHFNKHINEVPWLPKELLGEETALIEVYYLGWRRWELHTTNLLFTPPETWFRVPSPHCCGCSLSLAQVFQQQENETGNHFLRGVGDSPEREDSLQLSCLQIPEDLMFAGRIKLVLFVPEGWKSCRNKAWRLQGIRFQLTFREKDVRSAWKWRREDWVVTRAVAAADPA